MNNFAQTDSEGNLGRINKKGRKEIGEQRNGIIAGDIYKKQKYKEKEEHLNMITRDGKYVAQLIDLGKLCAFVTAFDFQPLEEQQIEAVGPFERPQDRESFKEGYTHGIMLAKHGLKKESYYKFREIYDYKYKNTEKENKIHR